MGSARAACCASRPHRLRYTSPYTLLLLLLLHLLPPPATHAFALDALLRRPKTSALHQTTPRALLECINSRHDPATPGTSWAAAMSDQPGSLRAAGAWWSNKQLRIPLTIVTQLSANRIVQLWAQCKSWPGPLSAAVHIAITQPGPLPLSPRNALRLQRTISAMAEFHAAIERDPSACRLDLLLVFEVFEEKRSSMLYPINLLRNLARLQARTDIVGLMDVDMLVSSKLAGTLLQPGEAALMRATCARRTVYVVPAFETYGLDAAAQADRLVRRTKESLVSHVRSGSAAPFDSKRFPPGHNTTDFARWYTERVQYKVDYTFRYEPWIIANRKAIPWHDVRFRGYGQNKIVHVAHTNASGFSFVVHPNGFIIHRAHDLTAARKQLMADMKEDRQLKRASSQGVGPDTVYGRSHMLWEEAKALMDSGRYAPVVDAASKHCSQVLAWWR